MSSILNDEVLIKVGPRGDILSGKTEWDESSYGNVKQIFITHGNAINSIQMLYDFDGNLALAHRHGGDGDNFVCINFESWEYLTSLTGYYGPIEQKGPVVIRSLTFETNGSTYGPYGREEGTPFRFNFQAGVKFGGFHGRCSSNYLAAIGAYVKTMARHYFKPDPPKYNITPCLCSSTTELPACVTPSYSRRYSAPAST
ncbi:jacalin-related lectin 19-like [Phoenix dactylifera]|uniref:Jacalin-related lectin 19-like n=1 Tax=Phoenix dactylifera TaxID=42345 RepID=A0A8B7BPN2_PHODC|nr:jacalin-related lectin 19-like [Phoenix dactylifera]